MRHKLSQLLLNNLRTLLNYLRYHKRDELIRGIILFLAIIYFLIAAHYLSFYLFRTLFEIPSLGPLLSFRVISIILLSLSVMLLFSNIITALTTMYLSKDLDLLLSLPLPVNSLFTYKYFQTTFYTSWMILLFGLPLLSAYGRVVGASFYFYPAILIVFLPLALIPASLGITITNLLMRFIPLSKAKSILLIIGLLIGALLVGLVRILSPQRLFSPSLISDFLKSLNTSQTPITPYLPNYFATMSLTSCAQGRVQPFFTHLLLLLFMAIFFYLFSTFLGRRLLFSGLAHTQTSSFRIGKKRKNLFLSSRLLPLSPFNQLIFKDIRLFIREITNWLPLLVLLPIVVVHLINLRGLKIEEAYVHNLVSFLNLGLVGFVITTVSVRFIYPSLSLEGESFWILRSAPVSLKKIFFEKWLLSFIPLFIFCGALIMATNFLIRVEPFIRILSLVTVFLLTATLTSLGIGMGGTFPKFRFDHPVYISTSAGGIFFMILCLFYVGMVI
ncbi:hypothetical protein KAT51_01540, partial [bacterium]|nr:hypothetical protein [bacterium]